MTGSRTILGLSILCAMAISAIAAQAASALGQTTVTCVETAPTKDYASAHCVPGDPGNKFGHVPVTEQTHSKTHNANTNATTTGPSNTIFKETIAATNLEFESTGTVEVLGTLKNEEVGGEMRGSAESDANGITFNGVVVKAPAGKGCKVFEDKGGVKGAEGVIKSKPVKARTVQNGAIDEVLMEPVTPAVFATFFIEGCEAVVPEALRGKWEVTGSVKCPSNGATIVCSHTSITTQNTLKGKGSKAGMEGKATRTAGKFPITEPTHPVSTTTF